MKTKSSKKTVETVRRLVAGAAVRAKVLEKKGSALIKKAEGAWDATKPRREKIAVSAKRAFGRAEKKAGELVRKTVQVKDDIATGVRQGIKDARKKA